MGINLQYIYTLITSAIGVHKRRDVDVIDTTGELLTTHMDEDVIMVTQGKLAELMVKTKPRIYRKFITIENGQTVLYVKI